ncbi:hypothetical protein QKW35_13950 [Pontibacterium granulatum]|uniref:hypothetical protein n=1 Tax=Pontibacterium granulatum TaxID=2036029 RepID=UPI00249BD4F5|nr:hypothetical protein [Pontibacterium granulatum]MDI3325481.1 hypothetical protein [Pontibacterium granulatum]
MRDHFVPCERYPDDNGCLEHWVEAEFHYYLYTRREGKDTSCYLYAWQLKPHRAYVLGVFDTRSQALLFVDLHRGNPLKVPALITPLEQPRFVADGWHQPYVGVYRIGYKSYRVSRLEAGTGLHSVDFLDRYKVQHLGVFSEKESCLEVYSHFDTRLRGCSMC